MKILAYSSVLIGLHAGGLACFYGVVSGALVIPRILLTVFATTAIYNIFRSCKRPGPLAATCLLACAFPAWVDGASGAGAWMLPECFLYILGLAILFDIRDSQSDKSAGIKTFACQWGTSQAKGLALACVFLSLTLLWRGLAEASFQRPGVIAGALAFSSFIIALIPNPESSEYVYLFLIDGLIGLKLVALLAA